MDAATQKRLVSEGNAKHHRLQQHWHGLWFLCSVASLIFSLGGCVWHGHGWVAHKQDAEREG